MSSDCGEVYLYVYTIVNMYVYLEYAIRGWLRSTNLPAFNLK